MNQKSPQDQPQPGPSSGNILSLTPTTLIVTESIASEIASDPSTSTDAINYTRATTRTKLKRNRLVLSCIPCHKRKQQCDRGQPCERCVKRGIEQQCHYGSAKKPKSTINEIDNNSPQDRVAQLEDMVQATLGNMDPAALVGIDSLLQLVHASNAIASPAAHLTGPGIADPVRVTEHAVLVATAALGQLSRPGANNHSRPFNGPIAEILSHIRYTNAAQFYSTPTSLSDLQTYFPDHSITTRMLTYFFETSSIPWLWSIIHRPTFDSCFIAFSSSRQSPALDFIALLAMICAVALQFFPASLEDATIFASYPPGRNVLQNRLYEFSRSILTTCINSSYVTLERIQALILLSLYNENDGKLTESYNATGAAVRMAQFLGMNRDGFTVWHMRPYDAELRRRLWWQIFALDRYQSLTLRRPYMIHEKHCDVVTPLNLDSTELCDVLDLQGKPLDQPTEHMYHILQIQWTTLLGRMWDQCFCAVVPSYRMILDIEDQIRRFELDIPACFRLQSVQAAHAKPYLLFQNQVLTLRIYYVRAVLLRPFFFRRPATDISNLPIDENKVAILTQYAQVVCITFCKRSLALLQLIITQNVNRGQLRWPMFTLSAFEPVLMLTVAILMDPRNSQNEELEEWITLGVAVLRELGQIDPMALNAVAGLHVVQKRVRLVVQAHGAGDTASDVPHIADINQNLDRATQTLAQIQPTIVDMIGVAESNDPFLVQHQIPEFLGNFPGVEFLCSQNDPQALESFLDTWITR